MTEKVKITQEQADAIKGYTENWSESSLVIRYNNRTIFAGYESLYKLNVDTLIRALYIGYEIKPERLRAGDWATEHAGEGYRIGKVKGLTGERYTVQFLGFETTDYYFELVHCSKLQKSTPEEITEEKERRKWANIGRVDGEFRDGDIALDKFGKVLHTIEEMEVAYQMGDLSGFHPAGSYISFEDGEAE